MQWLRHNGHSRSTTTAKAWRDRKFTLRSGCYSNELRNTTRSISLTGPWGKQTMTRLNWILWQDQTNSCASFKCVIRGKLKKKVIGNLDVERRKKASVSCMFSVRNEAESDFWATYFLLSASTTKPPKMLGTEATITTTTTPTGHPKRKSCPWTVLKTGLLVVSYSRRHTSFVLFTLNAI